MIVSGLILASSTRNSRPALGTGSSLLSSGRSAPGIQGTSLPHKATTRSASSWYISREPGPWAVGRGPWAVGRGPWAVVYGTNAPHLKRPLGCSKRVGDGELIVYLVGRVAI